MEQARAHVQGVRAALSSRSLALRAPPPEPTTCCGRGCNGCVWEGYEEALARWLDDARAVLG
nr:oxidoreductase-like domain-containing protein [Ramlibacter humi]